MLIPLLLTLAAPHFPVQQAETGVHGGPAARAGETAVSWERFEKLLVDRYALSEAGRLTLHHRLKAKVLEHLASEAGLVVSPAELDARHDELMRELGGKEGFAATLREVGVAPDLFLEYLRLGIVQDTLTRRALGIPQGDPVSGEQQELWLEEVMAGMGVKEYPAPWSDGQVCACGPVRVGLAEFLDHLRRVLEPEEQFEALYQLLLDQRVTARMPDLDPDAVDAALKVEVERRRVNVERNPKYQGVSYEQLLESQGIRYASWHQDPSVRIQALSQLWVERSYSIDDLERVYADEREHFDGTYGEAIETWVVFLKAVKWDNELQNRTFEKAEKELYEHSTRLRSRADFEKLAEEESEDEGTSAKKGRIGFVTRAGKEGHLALKSSIFAALDDGRFEPASNEDSRRRLLGPMRTPTGVVLFWLGELRPSPGWEWMALNVREEMRLRFLEQTLDRRKVRTYLDRE